MDFKEINFNSTPVKRIRFRGDTFQTETDPLIENDDGNDVYSFKNCEIPRERGLFTFFSIDFLLVLSEKRHALIFFIL